MKSARFTWAFSGILLLVLSILVQQGAFNSPFSADEVSAQSSSEVTTLCVNRYNGDVRQPRTDACASTETLIQLPEDYPFMMCANRYNGDLRISRTDTCASTEIEFPMPESGIIDVCVNRYNGDLRYSRTGTCASTETARQIAGNVAPEAEDDSYLAIVDETTSRATTDDDHLLANDQLGFPDAEIESFGGGDSGTGSDDVTTNPAGSSTTLAGGTLTINADGSFSLVNPTETGTFTVDYRLTNDAGSSDATVTFEIGIPPAAEDDTPANGVEYATLQNTPLSVDSTSGVLANDDLGEPDATLTTFGGGDLGGDVDDNAVGTTATFGADGSLTLNSDGSFNFTPETGFSGVFTFDYEIENIYGASTATVEIAVNVEPAAADDGPYDAPVDTTTAIGEGELLENDELGVPEATIVTFGGGDITGSTDVGDFDAGTTTGAGTFAGGTLTVQSNGDFTVTNPTTTGEFTFLYAIENDAGSSTAEVTVRVVQAPVAIDDSLTALVTEPFSLDAPGLLENDTLGFPEASIVSFGLSDAGATSAGNSIDFAGGTLTVNADGSLTLVNQRATGQFTFLYRIGNDAGTDEAQVTIDIQQTPTANDDSYFGVVEQTLTVEITDDHLLANDAVGVPAAEITSFGGGSIASSTVTSFAAGNSAGSGTFAGGTLTVNADGTLTLVNPTENGEFTFFYRLENTAGFSDAEVTIEIQSPPDAVDDGPGVDSSIGDPFHIGQNQTLVSDSSENLLTNDERGFPLATLTNAGTLPFDSDEGGSGTTTEGGTVSANADGSFTYTPPADFVGEDTFVYEIANNAGGDTATVTIRVGEPAEALSDTYSSTILGNVGIDTTASTQFNVLENDEGENISVTSYDTTSTNGGTVSLNGDGTFSYVPPPGYEGSDSFDYTIDNDFNQPSTGTVNLSISGMIWFIDENAGTGDGTLQNPFNCLVGTNCFDEEATDESGDSIFVYSGTTYSGGLTLLANQILVGQGATQSLGDLTSLSPPADSPALPTTGGTRPVLSATTNLTLGDANTITGLSLRAGTGISANGASGGTITHVDIQDSVGTGTGLDLDNIGGTFNLSNIDITAITTGIDVAGTNATLNFTADGAETNTVSTTNGSAIVASDVTINGTFETLSSASSGSDAIFLDGIGGGITAQGGSISQPATQAIEIVNSSLNFSYPGTITKTNNGVTGVNIANNTAGSTVLSGTIELSSGTTETAFAASSNGGHTIAVTGTGNTISTTGASALSVDQTTIASGGLNFESVSSQGGSAPGIYLNNTGSSAGLTISGDGTASSGGTISNKTGVNGSNGGVGIGLFNTASIALNDMSLSNFSNFAIQGNAVNGFTLTDSTIGGVNGDSVVDDEGSVLFTNLTGTASITGSTIEGAFTDNVSIVNTSGALNLTVDDVVIGLNDTTNGEDGVVIEAQSSASITATITNSSFQGARSDLLHVNGIDTSTVDVTVQDNSFINSHSNTVSGGGGVSLAGGSSTGNINFTYDISSTVAGSQVFQGANGTALTVNFVNGGGSASGTISENAIGASGVAESGSAQGSGILVGASGSVTHSVNVTNNVIKRVAANLAGIEVIGNGASNMNANIQNNSIDEIDGDFPFAGIYTMAGGNLDDTATVCVNIENNTVTVPSGSGASTIFIDQISSTAGYNIPGFTTGGDLAAFLGAQNTLAGGTVEDFSIDPAGVGSSCVS